MSPFPKENRSLIRKAVSSTPEQVQPQASGAECRIGARHGCGVEAACQPKRLAEIGRLTGRLIDEKQPAGSRKPASDTVLLAEVTLEAATAAGKTARVLARRFCVSGLWPLAENSILQLSIPAVGRKAL